MRYIHFLLSIRAMFRLKRKDLDNDYFDKLDNILSKEKLIKIMF